MQYQVNSLSGIEYKTLLPFMLMTFSMTWGLSALLIFFPDVIVDIFGDITASNPVFMLAVYSPGIAGVILIYCHNGLKGLTLFFRRLTL